MLHVLCVFWAGSAESSVLARRLILCALRCAILSMPTLRNDEQKKSKRGKSKRSNKNSYSPRKVQQEAEREMDTEDDTGYLAVTSTLEESAKVKDNDEYLEISATVQDKQSIKKKQGISISSYYSIKPCRNNENVRTPM